jgi:hypothetical protein
MARSIFIRRTLALAGTGMLAGLGLLAAAGPAAADSAPIAPVNAAFDAGVSAAQFEHSDWDWCPYGYYWHHEGLLSGLLDGTGHLLGALL